MGSTIRITDSSFIALATDNKVPVNSQSSGLCNSKHNSFISFLNSVRESSQEKPDDCNSPKHFIISDHVITSLIPF